MYILDFPWNHFYFVVMTLYLNKRLVYDIKLLSFKLDSEWVNTALFFSRNAIYMLISSKIKTILNTIAASEFGIRKVFLSWKDVTNIL